MRTKRRSIMEPSGPLNLPKPKSVCWIWPFGKLTTGYGAFRVKGVYTLAHRSYYRQAYGEIPKGYDIDHLCKNTSCVNPEHLEAVTHRENCLRSSMTLKIGDKCSRGHLVIPGNFKLRKEGFKRCLLCMKEDNNR